MHAAPAIRGIQPGAFRGAPVGGGLRNAGALRNGPVGRLGTYRAGSSGVARYGMTRGTYGARSAGVSERSAGYGGRSSSRHYAYGRSAWRREARAYSAAAAYSGADSGYSNSGYGYGYSDGDYEATVSSGKTGGCVVESRVVRRNDGYRTIRVQVCD